MIKKAYRDDLSQISLTGLRAIVLLGLLIKAPRSLEEIKEAYIDYNVMLDSNSTDIIRIDINTLRNMGCEISRADHRTNNKFVLISHPFKVNITHEEANTIKRAFDKVKENSDISFLVAYDTLFKKIADGVADEEIKEELLGISPLKSYSLNIIEELKTACDNKNTVKLIYKMPTTNKEIEKEIISDKITLQNNKLYFYGVDKNSKNPIYLNIKRILGLTSQYRSDDEFRSTPVVVKFKLKDFGVSGLVENEKILCGDLEEGFVVEGKYHNEFFAIQRILSFGPMCKVLEPNDIKIKIVEKLKKMKEIYSD